MHHTLKTECGGDYKETNQGLTQPDPGSDSQVDRGGMERVHGREQPGASENQVRFKVLTLDMYTYIGYCGLQTVSDGSYLFNHS